MTYCIFIKILQNTVGRFDLCTGNNSGERLMQLCANTKIFLCNSGFQRHPRQLYMWQSTGDKYRNQIDCILINTKWRASIKDTKTYPGKYCDIDHQLLAAEINIKLRKRQIQNFFSNRRYLSSHRRYNQKATQRLVDVAELAKLTTDLQTVWGSIKNALEQTTKNLCTPCKRKKHG